MAIGRLVNGEGCKTFLEKKRGGGTQWKDWLLSCEES